MSIQIINNGSSNNAPDADSGRVAFGKTNANFAELDARVRAIEGFSLPRGQYTEPGNPPFADFIYTAKNVNGVTLLDTVALNGAANGFGGGLSGNFVIHALDTETVAVVSVSSTNFYVNIYKIVNGAFSLYKSSGSQSTSIANSASIAAVYSVSPTSFGVLFSSSGNAQNFQIDISAEEISFTKAPMPWTSGMRSRNAKGILSASGLTFSMFSSHSTMSSVFRASTVPGSRDTSVVTVGSTKSSENLAPAHDYLGNGRFIAAHIGSRRGEGNFFTISVFDSDDDSVRLKGTAVVPTPDAVGSISLFALSPTLAIASWSSGGVQRACSVSVDSDGNPAFLGEIQLSGALGNVLFAGTTLNEKTLLAGIWPTDTLPGQLVKLRVDTDAGQIVEEQSFQISATTKSRFADFIRLTDDKFVVVSTPTASPFGITLELVEFVE